MKVMTEKIPAKLFGLAPVQMANERAVLPCGCAVYVGVVVKDEEPEAMTMAYPCSPEHRDSVMVPYNERFKKSLENPTDRPLIDVVAEFLEEVAP